MCHYNSQMASHSVQTRKSLAVAQKSAQGGRCQFGAPHSWPRNGIQGLRVVGGVSHPSKGGHASDIIGKWFYKKPHSSVPKRKRFVGSTSTFASLRYLLNIGLFYPLKSFRLQFVCSQEETVISPPPPPKSLTCLKWYCSNFQFYRRTGTFLKSFSNLLHVLNIQLAKECSSRSLTVCLLWWLSTAAKLQRHRENISDSY